MTETALPEKLKQLHTSVGGVPSGLLTRESQYTFTYSRDDADQPTVSLLMRPDRLVHSGGDLFPSMDMNLPEGFLFQQILDRHPKQQLTKLHLLALMGHNGIGRVGFSVSDAASPERPVIDRRRLLASTAGPQLFTELVDTYLSVSAGVSGVQPKLMVPTRATVPIPDVLVKVAGTDYPALPANEHLCLEAARRAGIAVARNELSADGSILVVDRFDMSEDGTRLGFEDIAALMGLQVHDRLSDRKYQSSYERVAEAVRLYSAEPAQDLARFYEQLVLSVMVRNGDAHLKNFGMLYTGERDVRLAPMFDVVTTTVYTYQRPGGVESVDRTLALKLRAGRRGDKAYPDTQALRSFGQEVCGVRQAQAVIDRIAQAMSDTLVAARSDARIDAALLQRITPEWESGQGHATRRGSAQ
jgi:serine/threonine-protein kinase HipA